MVLLIIHFETRVKLCGHISDYFTPKLAKRAWDIFVDRIFRVTTPETAQRIGGLCNIYARSTFKSNAEQSQLGDRLGNGNPIHGNFPSLQPTRQSPNFHFHQPVPGPPSRFFLLRHGGVWRVESWARGVKWIMAHDGHTWFISDSQSCPPRSAPACNQYGPDWALVSTFFPPRQLLIDIRPQCRGRYVDVDIKFMYSPNFYHFKWRQFQARRTSKGLTDSLRLGFEINNIVSN